MVTQTYATARWQQLTTHTADGFDYRLVILWAGNQWELGARLVVCQGRQQPLQLITIWLELREENDTHGGVEKIPEDDLEGGRWWGHHPSTNTSLVCFDTIIVQLNCWWTSCLPKWKISVTFKEDSESRWRARLFCRPRVTPRLIGLLSGCTAQFASYQNHCWCWSEAKCYRNL